MKNKKNIIAFTMTELIVAITIVVILSAIGFTAYSGYISTARDSQRKADFANIESALKTYKHERGFYPEPGNTFNLYYDNSANIVAKQGELNESVHLDKLNSLPTDPKNKALNYSYSVTRNNLEYQIAGTLENDDNPIALLSGDYATVSIKILPTIMLASKDSDIDIKSTTNLFIYNGDGRNLPYQINGSIISPLQEGIDILEAKGNVGANDGLVWQNSSFMSCDEIEAAGKLLYEGDTLDYQIIDTDLSATDYITISCP